MKNIERLRGLIEERWKFVGLCHGGTDPIAQYNYIEDAMECFESAKEVEEFIKTEKYVYVSGLSELYEAIIEKFPDSLDRLGYLFEKFVFTSYPNGIPTAPPKYDESLDDWSEEEE